VREPLQTGLKAIDSMTPIGRGQRELIIGDRQTGKTAIALDTIINQKDTHKTDSPVFCIYVAIGQKAIHGRSGCGSLKKGRRHGLHLRRGRHCLRNGADALHRAYAGATMGEYFRDRGQHVLCITTIFRNTPWPIASSPCCCAVRQAAKPTPATFSTCIRAFWSAPPRCPSITSSFRRTRRRRSLTQWMGKEYKSVLDHLEGKKVLAARPDKDALAWKKVPGTGGSLTALPVIETQAGDVSAYIPTNVISITDGQIFLETDLFYSGVRRPSTPVSPFRVSAATLRSRP